MQRRWVVHMEVSACNCARPDQSSGMVGMVGIVGSPPVGATAGDIMGDVIGVERSDVAGEPRGVLCLTNDQTYDEQWSP